MHLILALEIGFDRLFLINLCVLEMDVVSIEYANLFLSSAIKERMQVIKYEKWSY